MEYDDFTRDGERWEIGRCGSDYWCEEGDCQSRAAFECHCLEMDSCASRFLCLEHSRSFSGFDDLEID